MTTPNATRQTRRRAKLVASGGRQVAVHLSADAVAALDALKDVYPSQSAAISAALMAFTNNVA